MTDTYRIPYRTYKQHYADCQTVPGTYHERPFALRTPESSFPGTAPGTFNNGHSRRAAQ